jgi:hypothetical protein
MRLSARRRLGAILFSAVVLLSSACSEDGGGVGQGAARVGGDLEDTGGGAVSPTTTTASDAAARDVANRALARVLGDAALTRLPPAVLQTGINRAKGGMGYDALVEATLRDYVNEAYNRIFRYRSDPAYTPAIYAVRFDETVFQRLLAVVRGTGTRGSLALPDTRTVPADAEGIWTYVAESAPVWGAHHNGRPDSENCVGGAGPRCKGVSPLAEKPVNVDGFTRMDGIPMGYIEMAVAVGSIIHDRSCADKRPDYLVVYCNGETPPHGPSEDLIAKAGLTAGELEWRKAAYNLRDGRRWNFRFGPYPIDGSTDPGSNPSTTSGMRAGSPADHFADDIRLRPGRPTSGSSTQTATWDTPYNREEFAATTVLFATPGKSLDPMDGRFCNNAKGGFASTGNNGLTSWGVC